MPDLPRPQWSSPPNWSRWLRRRRAPRMLASMAAIALLAVPMTSAQRGAERAAAAWSPSPVWIAMTDIAPGEVISASAVEQRLVPASLLPGDAMVEDPTGRTTRTGLAINEILRSERLSPLSDDRGGIELQTPSAHLEIGALVDLYDVLTGRRVARDANVIGLDEQQRPTVAVSSAEIGAVIRAFANGEVVPVLVG